MEIDMPILNIDWQHSFVSEWQAAWNGKDVEKILSFYQNGFAMTSPFVSECLNISRHLCVGRNEFEKFCHYIFINFPEYELYIIGSIIKRDAITLYYHDCFCRLVTETMQFSLDGKIMNVAAYY